MPDFEQRNIVPEARGGAAGGYYVGKTIVQNILCAGLWWPTMRKDSKEYCRACDACQRTGRLSQRD